MDDKTGRHNLKIEFFFCSMKEGWIQRRFYYTSFPLTNLFDFSADCRIKSESTLIFIHSWGWGCQDVIVLNRFTLMISFIHLNIFWLRDRMSSLRSFVQLSSGANFKIMIVSHFVFNSISYLRFGSIKRSRRKWTHLWLNRISSWTFSLLKKLTTKQKSSIIMKSGIVIVDWC